MAHANTQGRAFAPPIVFVIATVATVVAGIALAAVLSFSAIGSLDLDGPRAYAPANPNLLAAEGRWELERKLQSGDVDPLTRQQREWERQRHQQSPFD